MIEANTAEVATAEVALGAHTVFDRSFDSAVSLGIIDQGRFSAANFVFSEENSPTKKISGMLKFREEGPCVYKRMSFLHPLTIM